MVDTDGDVKGCHNVNPAEQEIDEQPEGSPAGVDVCNFREGNEHGREIGDNSDRDKDAKGIRANVSEGVVHSVRTGTATGHR